MKKIWFILGIILVLAFSTACSENNNEPKYGRESSSSRKDDDDGESKIGKLFDKLNDKLNSENNDPDDPDDNGTEIINIEVTGLPVTPTPEPTTDGPAKENGVDAGVMVNVEVGSSWQMMTFGEAQELIRQGEKGLTIDLLENTIVVDETIIVKTWVNFRNGTLQIRTSPGFSCSSEGNLTFSGNNMKIVVEKDYLGFLATRRINFEGTVIEAYGTAFMPDYDVDAVSGDGVSSPNFRDKAVISVIGGTLLYVPNKDAEVRFSCGDFFLSLGAVGAENHGNLHFGFNKAGVDGSTLVFNHKDSTGNIQAGQADLVSGTAVINEGSLELHCAFTVKEGTAVSNKGTLTGGTTTASVPGTIYKDKLIVNLPGGKMDMSILNILIFTSEGGIGIENDGEITASPTIVLGTPDRRGSKYYKFDSEISWCDVTDEIEKYYLGATNTLKGVRGIVNKTGGSITGGMKMVINGVMADDTTVLGKNIGFLNLSGGNANEISVYAYLLGKDVCAVYNSSGTELKHFKISAQCEPDDIDYINGDKNELLQDKSNFLQDSLVLFNAGDMSDHSGVYVVGMCAMGCTAVYNKGNFDKNFEYVDITMFGDNNTAFRNEGFFGKTIEESYGALDIEIIGKNNVGVDNTGIIQNIGIYENIDGESSTGVRNTGTFGESEDRTFNLEFEFHIAQSTDCKDIVVLDNDGTIIISYDLLFYQFDNELTGGVFLKNRDHGKATFRTFCLSSQERLYSDGMFIDNAGEIVNYLRFSGSNSLKDFTMVRNTGTMNGIDMDLNRYNNENVVMLENRGTIKGKDLKLSSDFRGMYITVLENYGDIDVEGTFQISVGYDGTASEYTAVTSASTLGKNSGTIKANSISFRVVEDGGNTGCSEGNYTFVESFHSTRIKDGKTNGHWIWFDYQGRHEEIITNGVATVIE